MLALEKREFVFEFNHEIKQPSSHLNLIDFSVEDWSDVSKLKELQADANRHAIAKIKNYMHKTNVSFVWLITLILILTVIGFLLLLCYYYNCYSFVHCKLIKFYQRTCKFKNKRKLKNAVVYKNTQEPVKHKTSVVSSTSPDPINQDYKERQEARSSRNRPSYVLRPKATTQDATSDRITFDF